MTTTQITWSAERDSYGRSNHVARKGGKTLGVLVVLPKAYRQEYGQSHLFNHWAGERVEGRTPVHYFLGTTAKLKQQIEAGVLAAA